MPSPLYCILHTSTIKQYSTHRTNIRKQKTARSFATYYITHTCNVLMLDKYKTTTPWNCVLLQKPPVPQLLKNFPPFLWNPKVHCHVHKSLPLVPTLNHPHPIYLTTILILSSHLRLGLPSGLFPYGFPIKILHAFLFSPCVVHTLPISSSLT
jgi:hypothetical protein